jgi:hypothetical protein
MAIDIKTRVTSDATDYNRKMDGVKSKWKDTSQKMERDSSQVFAGLGSKIAGAFAIGTVAAFSKTLMDAAGNVRDIADSLDITAANLQAIRGVGLVTNQDAGKVDAILGKLERFKRAALDGNQSRERETAFLQRRERLLYQPTSRHRTG